MLGPPSPTSRQITIKASSEASPSRNYQLRIKTKTGVIKLPIAMVRLEVAIDPNFFTVTGFEPDSGERGSILRIRGNGFLKRSTVHVEFTNNTGTVINQSGEVIKKANTLLEVLVPPGAHSGPLEIYSGSGTDFEKTTTSSSFTVLLRPVIMEFNPKSGSVGTRVEIKGVNITKEDDWFSVIKFFPDQTFQIRGSGRSAGERTEKGEVRIYAVYVPEGASSGPITALNPYGSFATSEEFTILGAPMNTLPRIESFSPDHGDIGTELTIFGSFDPIVENNIVEFRGNTAGKNPHFCNGSELKIIVPPNSFTGQITVRNLRGPAASADTFYLPPDIARFDVPSGPVGFITKVYGKNFDLNNKDVNIVRFNGIQASVVETSHSNATGEDVLGVEIPEGATTGPVTVETPGGTATSPVNFTIVTRRNR